MSTPPIRIDLLGGLGAHCGGQVVRSFETRKAAELLAFLAINPPESNHKPLEAMAQAIASKLFGQAKILFSKKVCEDSSSAGVI